MEGDELVFNKDYSNVTILYHGIITDDEGLPYLNDKAEIILYVTPFLRPHERDALNKVSECLKKYIEMRLEKTSNQQYVIVKKL